MNRRDQMEGGRGQDDWRSGNDRSGWGPQGGENRFGGGMRGAQGQGRFAGSVAGDEQNANARGYGVGSALEGEGGVRVSHRGKGPKGYKRNDERIREDASQLLFDHHEVDASELELVVKDGEITLSGTVPDRQTKRLAERVVESVSGVVDVHNTLRVARPEAAQTPAQGNQNRAHS